MSKKKKVNQQIKTFSFQGFDNKHYQTTEEYVRVVDKLFDRATKEIAQLSNTVKYNPNKAFSFDDYPKTFAQVKKVIDGLANNMTSVIDTATYRQWLFACEKNDAFLNSLFNTTKIAKDDLQQMQDRNLDALQTFQRRKVAGMDLSQRVWKYVDQYKDQIELGLDVGLGDGRSAQQLSRDLRQNLQDPDRLFRRVRDKRGNLQLSKAAKAFNPGQGVYRSSARNAERLTRTEINMAYRESDYLRWQQLDFVIGFEIRVSERHNVWLEEVWNKRNPGKIEICDKLAGKYPKWFKFRGWHPQCMCYVIPIMEDYFSGSRSNDRVNRLKAALNGNEHKKYVSKETITDVPQGFKDWVAENTEKQSKWKSAPFFVRDNFKDSLLSGGLKYAPTKRIKTPEEKAAIQMRWNTRVASRKYDDKLNEILWKYGNEAPSIEKLVNKIKKDITAGKNISDVDVLVGKLHHKVTIKEAWEERREENRLGVLLVDVKQLKQQFGLAETQKVFGAVADKLASWDSLTLQEQKKKLEFEIEWVEKHKKYDTWKAAQDAYKKRLSLINYQVEKNMVKISIVQAFEFSKTTKSSNVKELAKELDDLFKKNAPISELRSKAEILKDKVAKLEAAKAAREAKKHLSKLGDIDEYKYSQKRKDAALWAKTSKTADSKLRQNTADVWTSATPEEKQAAYEYTSGSGGFNRPLRGYNKTWSEDSFKGIGKVDLNNEGKGVQIENLTKIIDKSSYSFDVWLQRGVDNSGLASLLGLKTTQLTNMTQQELQSFVGRVVTEPAFISCGSAKGTGFGGNIFNIYCPSGTKMLYAEPFSYFGGSPGQIWDGQSKKTLRYELETIIQRNTSFRITKVEKQYGKVYIDMEVVAQ